MRNAFLFFLCLVARQLQGQTVISAGTTIASGTSTTATSGGIVNRSQLVDLKKATLVLVGSTPQTIDNKTSTPFALGGLTVDNTTTYTVKGKWNVVNDLTFADGKLITAKADELTYEGARDLNSNARQDSYVIGPLFVQGQLGVRTFPIGNTSSYLPARLQNVEAADAATPLGMAVVADPGFQAAKSDHIFPDHFWELVVGSGPLKSQTQIALSGNGLRRFFGDSTATVLEMESSRATANKGGIDDNEYVISKQPISSLGKYYALEKIDRTIVKIRKLITPDDDGENDVLYIEGIEAVPDNRVTILDRWGVPVKTWSTPFANYPSPARANQPQDGIDFRSLAIGNYIVIVQYTQNGQRKNVQQMVAVLK